MSKYTCVCVYICICIHLPKNGEIAMWSSTRVVKYKYDVSQKQNGLNDKYQWYNILVTFISKFKCASIID